MRLTNLHRQVVRFIKMVQRDLDYPRIKYLQLASTRRRNPGPFGQALHDLGDIRGHVLFLNEPIHSNRMEYSRRHV